MKENRLLKKGKSCRNVILVVLSALPYGDGKMGVGEQIGFGSEDCLEE